jgi:hypothetical protein
VDCCIRLSSALRSKRSIASSLQDLTGGMDAASAAMRDRIKALYAERQAMEFEMAEIAQRLSGPGMPGLRGSLVDEEGFPMPGVDLYAVGEEPRPGPGPVPGPGPACELHPEGSVLPPTCASFLSHASNLKSEICAS